MRQRYKKSLRAKRKKPIYKKSSFWFSFLLFLLSGAITYLALISPVFQIEEVKIFGDKGYNKRVSEIIERSINRRLMFFNSRSIFLANPFQIKKDILNAVPQIADAQIKRKFSNKLEVRLKKRQPVAVLVSGKNNFLLDKEGIIFQRVLNDKPGTMKIKKSSPRENLRLGEKVIDSQLISKILKISSQMMSLKVRVAEVDIISDERINLKSSEGWEAYLNPRKDIGWQLTKLKLDLENEIPLEKRKNLDYIDLRFGNFAPFKYR